MDKILVGRLGILERNVFENKENSFIDQTKIILNSYSSRLFEKIIVSLFFNESLLLVGDTGCGKTTLVQYAAKVLFKYIY